MKILMFVEQIEHIAGMERIALQMGKALTARGHEVFYEVTYGKTDTVDNVITLSEKDLPNILRENEFDVIINHCDWNYSFLKSLLSIDLPISKTKVFTICHSDFWSLLSVPTTPKHDLLPLYLKLRTRMSIIAISDNDYKCFTDIGFNTYLWKFGTEGKQNKFRNHHKYNRIAFVSARWDIPKKNYQYAEMLFNKLSNIINCEVVAFGKNWRGEDHYGGESEIYQPGTLIVMPSFRETRPLTSISAYKSNCPIFVLKKWIGLPNEIELYGSLDKDINLISAFLGKKVKRFKARKELDLSYSMNILCNIIETDMYEDTYNLKVNVGSDAYLACQSRREWQSNFANSNLICDYRNKWLPQRNRVLILADGIGATNIVKTETAEYTITYRNTILGNGSNLNRLIKNIKPTYVGIVKNNKYLNGNNIIQYDKRICGFDVINIEGVADFYLTDRFEFDDSGSEKPIWTLFGEPTKMVVQTGGF